VTLSGSQVLMKGQMGRVHCPDIKRLGIELRKKKLFTSLRWIVPRSHKITPPPYYSNLGTTRNIQSGAQVPRVNELKIECQVAFATLCINEET